MSASLATATGLHRFASDTTKLWLEIQLSSPGIRATINTIINDTGASNCSVNNTGRGY
jgi:hypothetical protein